MKLKTHILFPFLLIFITVVLCLLNYAPGTYLTGWDTLHPEFNFPLNFSRLIFGVWRTDQGLGAVAGHSHMADLPRVLFLWLSHFVLPQNFLRYSYIFFCLIIGPLGFYFLLKKIFLRSTINDLTSFLGALLYLFNLSTLQQFYVPFEMFPTQWAFLPWIMLFTLKFLHHPHRRSLLLFSFATLLATPQAYAAHLWYPFFGVYCITVLLISITNHLKPRLGLTLIALTLLLNSFWLLPNIFYVLTSSSTPRDAQTNRLHSQEFLIRNRETGTPKDVGLIKGFYFNWGVYNFNNQSGDTLMPQWTSHLKNWDVLMIGYLIFAFSLIGLTLSFVHKNKIFASFAPLFIIPLILLLNDTPPFNYIFELLLKIPIIQEILRFVFTKISIIFTFGLCVYFSYFLNFVFFLFHSKKFLLVSSFSFLVSLLIYCLPLFQGFLISPAVKVAIPQSYQKLWQFMEQKPDGRILSLPLNEPTGWQYYQWGYQGSGFVWFGLPQSIFDRDSDRWQSKNEQAYREFFYSVYGINPTTLVDNLQKYQVKYILWDQNVTSTSPKNQDQITFKNEIDSLLNILSNQGLISPIYNDQKIYVYQVNQPTSLVQAQKITNLEANNQNGIFSLTNSQNRLDLSKFTPPSESYPLTSLIQSYYSHNTTNGFHQDLPDPPHSQGLIIGFKSQFKAGIPLRFCLKNSLSGICTFEDELSRFDKPSWDYFVVPPQDPSNGYDFQLNSISFANFSSKTDVLDAVYIPLSPEFFSNLNSLHQTSPATNLTSASIFPNNSLISVKNIPSDANYLTLNQTYSPHWLAFYFQGLRPIFLSGHTPVNNWANGWELPTTNHYPLNTIYLLFWPQLLESLGFAITPVSLLWISRKRVL